MSALNTFKIITLSVIFAILLNGCGATRTGTNAGRMETQSPSEQLSKSEALPQSSASPQADQKIHDPVQGSSRGSLQGREESTEAREIDVSQADIEFVQLRLISYEHKFEHWLDIFEMYQGGTLAEELTELESECVQNLERILNGYSLILESMQLNDSVPVDRLATVDPKEMQQFDIAFLESRCSELLALDISNQFDVMAESEPEPTFSSAQEVIASLTLEGNYQEVLFAYGRLSQDFPDQVPSLATQMNYGLALQYTGQIEAAARHFKSMLEAEGLLIEPLSLQREIADLLLASGNIAAAESYYDSIILAHESIGSEISWAEEQLAFLRSVEPDSEDMVAYLKLMREFHTYDYRIYAPELNVRINAFAREFAGSPAAVSGLRLKTFAVDRLKYWFDSQLVRIDSLVADKKFTEATDILKSMTRYYLPAEMQAVVQKTYYEVAQTEIQAIETQQRIQEMELTEQWDAAVNLLDTQHYDSAISAFEALMSTEYEEKAKMKITEAANLAAGSMRKKAASLFIKAGKTPDLEQKKELLLASHGLLTEILTKYPQTDLLNKVEQNIAIVEKQIQRFDPTLLEELHQEKDPEQPDDSPGPFSRQLQ